MMAAHGRLKVYLGATPGAGKTFAMLRESLQRKQRGEDVVIAYVETYGRARIEELLPGLDQIPRKKIPYRGTVLEEMDVDAVLERRPTIALVDELAHTNAPGSANEKRWQDIEQLRDAGIDIISTLNVQHVESVNDVVEKITGIVQRETIPDRVLDLADEVQFIDISPEALRKRMRHGNIYQPEKVETALANFFRPGNLAALREIALRLVAQSMATSREVMAPAEDVLVAISGSAESEPLIRRAVRLARGLGGLCMVVMVGSGGGVNKERYQRLSAQLGCSVVSLGGPDVGRGIIEAAQLANVRHLFIGQSGQPGFLSLWHKTLPDQLIDSLLGVDVGPVVGVARSAVAVTGAVGVLGSRVGAGAAAGGSDGAAAALPAAVAVGVGVEQLVQLPVVAVEHEDVPVALGLRPALDRRVRPHASPDRVVR